MLLTYLLVMSSDEIKHTFDLVVSKQQLCHTMKINGNNSLL